MEIHDIVRKAEIKTIPKKKKCKKAKWLSEEALQIAERRREAKGKGEKERYTHLNTEFQSIARCRELVRDIPLVTKVMRKEARHTQRRDRASGVPLDILEHLPLKNQSLPTLLLCALISDFTGGCPPPPSRSLCQRVNLQLQLIKFLGN